MNTRNQSISQACRKRLETQGYLNFSDSELSAHRFGIRFAYWVCITLASIGLIAGSLCFCIALVIIVLQSVKAANENPVKAMKNE